jgi:hypothetical protein
MLIHRQMPDDFARFCHATQRWLSDAESLDPALAATLDLLRGHQHTSEAHVVLGAHTLDTLWQAIAQGELERV